MKFQRVAGPLGRLFGFIVECGRVSVSFNSGWYVVALRIRGVGFVDVALRPLQFGWYISGVSK